MANSNLMTYNPFAELQALQKQFFGDDWFSTLPKTMQLPTTDVYTEDDKRLIVEAHLPHFDEKDVTVDIDNGVLEIQAEKHETDMDKDKDKKYMIRESSSSFYRRVRLPDHADTAHVDARMDNGVLKISVPFKKIPAPKKVAIGHGSTGKKAAKKK